MSTTQHRSPQLVSLQYAIEELAVVADLFDLPSLPGVEPVEISPALRSLAARTLIARRVVTMPANGGVEIIQPHATVIAALFDATDVVQVSETSVARPAPASWFRARGYCVRVPAHDEGIVSIDAFDGELLANAQRELGIDELSIATDDLDLARCSRTIALTHISLDGNAATTQSWHWAEIDGTWYTTLAGGPLP